MSAAHYGLVEAGGTKFILGVADAKGEIVERVRIPTTTPEETIATMLAWFGRRGPFASIGLATFGPVGLDPASADWGHILKTPKPGWSGADLAGPLRQRFDCPVVVDTDVNAAALAESLWGAGKDAATVLYFTVGTGIGGGAVIDGKTLRGVGHPEMGHIRLPRHPDDSAFVGTCPFHGDCLEGLASGPAIAARWGKSLSELPADHPAHAIIAWYLAQAVVTMQAIFEPGRIVLGGGVMATPGLLERARKIAAELGGGYFRSDAEAIVVAPGLGDNTGLMGALALALNSTSAQPAPAA
jgi:fructokinase